MTSTQGEAPDPTIRHAAAATGSVDPDAARPRDWSAAIVNYNGGNLVCATIASLKALEHPPSEIILVDDGSTDDGLAEVAGRHADVRIVSMGRNTKQPNIARNEGLRLARHRHVLVTDNDILLEHRSVTLLLEAIGRLEDATVCTPLVVTSEDRSSVLVDGHPLHFVCWSTRGSTTVDEARRRGVRTGIGCGIQLIDKSRIGAIGALDPGMALGWGDDGEFHYRVRLAGLGSYVIPEAVVYHRRVRQQSRFYGQVHNRWRMLLKDYQWHTLLRAAPALVIFEIMLAAALVAAGAGREYGRAIRDVAAEWPEIRRLRREVQASRRVADSEILSAAQLAAPRRLYEYAPVRGGLALLSGLLRLYWSLVCPRWRANRTDLVQVSPVR